MRAKVATGVAALFVWFSSALPGQPSAARFQAHPATEAYRGRNAQLILSKADRAFGTRLRRAAAQKPSFARHYILTAWGCGAECLMGAAIDANTGRVHWFPFTICCWGEGTSDDFRPIEFRLDSNLIVFRGARNEDSGDGGEHYFEMRNGRFSEIKKP